MPRLIPTRDGLLQHASRAAIRAAHSLATRIQNNEPDGVKRKKIELSEVINRYMQYQKNSGRAPKTIEKYEHVLGTLVDWAGARGRSSAHSFSAKDFWEFANWMSDEKKLGRKTCADRMVIAKQVFKWAAVGAERAPVFPVLTSDASRSGSA